MSRQRVFSRTTKTSVRDFCDIGYLLAGPDRSHQATTERRIGRKPRKFLDKFESIRVAAGHGLGSLAKMAAVIEATTADRIAASAGVRSGPQGTDIDNAGGPMNLSTIGIGSLPFLRAGEKITRPGAGPGEVQGQTRGAGVIAAGDFNALAAT